MERNHSLHWNVKSARFSRFISNVDTEERLESIEPIGDKIPTTSRYVEDDGFYILK